MFLASFGHVHLVLPYGKAIWQSHMAMPYGNAKWQRHMAKAYGKAIWQRHMAMPYGIAIRAAAAAVAAASVFRWKKNTFAGILTLKK